jgi:hypothetical protein
MRQAWPARYKAFLRYQHRLQSIADRGLAHSARIDPLGQEIITDDIASQQFTNRMRNKDGYN